MVKVKTHPWDPSDHIVDGEDVLAYLQVITEEEYDPKVTPFLLNCIARSKGVAEIARVTLNEPNAGQRSVTVTTTAGASTTIPIAPDVDSDAILQALSPRPAVKPVHT